MRNQDRAVEKLRHGGVEEPRVKELCTVLCCQIIQGIRGWPGHVITRGQGRYILAGRESQGSGPLHGSFRAALPMEGPGIDLPRVAVQPCARVHLSPEGDVVA